MSTMVYISFLVMYEACMQIWLPNVAELKTWCWPHRLLLVRLGGATETFRTSDGSYFVLWLVCVPQVKV